MNNILNSSDTVMLLRTCYMIYNCGKVVYSAYQYVNCGYKIVKYLRFKPEKLNYICVTEEDDFLIVET